MIKKYLKIILCNETNHTYKDKNNKKHMLFENIKIRFVSFGIRIIKAVDINNTSREQ